MIATAILLRVVPYMANRSLWYDEALLALNIVPRSLLELFQPLDYAQAAPPGFLILMKVATIGFGDNEYALRLVPLLAGLGSVPLVYLIARRWLGVLATLAALAFFAVSESLIYYSSEAKQYAMDVLIGLVLLYSAILILHEGRKTRGLLLLGLAGTLGVWMSHPSVFVLASVSLVLTISALKAGQRRLCAVLVGITILSSVSFVAHYGLFLKRLTESPHL